MDRSFSILTKKESRMNREKKLADSDACALQNSHDKEICARSLRATQESRPTPGAFPLPPPAAAVAAQHHHQSHHQQQQQHYQQQQRCCAMNHQSSQRITSNGNGSRPPRPASLDIGVARRYPIGCSRIAASPSVTTNEPPAPSSAPAACKARGFFDDVPSANTNGNNCSSNNVAPGFELNVNVACSPAGNRGTM